jgi:Trypsin-like peptidase domain
LRPNEELLARAERAFGDRPVADAVAKVRAIVGVPHVPDGEAAAQSALDKLQAHRAPTVAELAALEFVIRMMRPAPLCQGGHLASLPVHAGTNVYDGRMVAAWDTFRESVRPFLHSIGRLDRAEGKDPQQGTGFLVADDLLMTNRHVLDVLSYGAGVLEEGDAVVRFYQEYGTTDPRDASVPIVEVAKVHPMLDMVLLRVKLAEARPVPPIALTAAAQGTAIAAIGYPQRDPNSPLFAEAIFGGRYGVKRGAIGEVLDERPDRMMHDCSTLGGNSGSPIFSLQQGAVVGLHYSGMFMYRNEALPAPQIGDFVASAG